jgi:hypothetical protein
MNRFGMSLVAGLLGLAVSGGQAWAHGHGGGGGHGGGFGGGHGGGFGGHGFGGHGFGGHGFGGHQPAMHPGSHHMGHAGHAGHAGHVGHAGHAGHAGHHAGTHHIGKAGVVGKHGLKGKGGLAVKGNGKGKVGIKGAAHFKGGKGGKGVKGVKVAGLKGHHHHHHHHHHFPGGYWIGDPLVGGGIGDPVIGAEDGGVVAGDGEEAADDSAPASEVQQLRRLLQVKNSTGEKVRLWVQYRTLNSDGSWSWYPSAPGGDDAVAFELEPGEETYLNDDDWTLKAARVRIWAESDSGNEWLDYKDDDLWLVEEQPDGYRYYYADDMETFTFTIE